ncbi:hypothetical protein ACEQ8H_006860 [Pleosporales sp. CAS-2024a]
MSHMACVVLIGTCDTKLEELLFLRDQITSESVGVFFIDVGQKPVQHDAITLTQDRLVREYGDGMQQDERPRGEVIKAMAAFATKAVQSLYNQGRVHGIVSAGGSGGTSLASEVMRAALPIGFPKMIVSTVASGDTGPIVEETDITLMSSVVDIAGLNRILRRVLSNAGHAIAAMSRGYAAIADKTTRTEPARRRVGITMFGVTTPAVDTIRRYLESEHAIETYVFHATGHGGKAMERLIRQGELDAVLDLTTTEICDLHTGGVMSAGPHRLEAAASAGIPNIVSVGATDMSNFGPRTTVLSRAILHANPERYKDRKLYEHNPVVTLMRTSKDEAREVGEFIAKKLRNHAKDPRMIEVWLPRGGISMISTPGGPFADEEADIILFQTLKGQLANSDIEVVDDKRAINDKTFARDIANALIMKMGLADEKIS